MKLKLLFALIWITLLGACSSMEPASSQGVADDDDYVTGSNLPHKSGAKKVQTMTPEQIDDMKRGASSPRG